MKTVMITGASRGLGLEMVWQLLQQEDGPRVIATCRDPQKANGLQRMLTQHPDRLRVYEMDVADEESILNACEMISADADAIDWLVNNAGIGGFAGLHETDQESLLQTFRTNVIGVFLVTRAILPLLESASEAMVFLVSSRMGSVGFAAGNDLESFAYPVSKAGLNMLGVQLAKALRTKGIGVILQSPGWVNTDMGGDGAPLTPKQSIEKLLKLWSSLGLEHSGRFFGEDGDLIEW